jgi:hypothetical protein
VRRRLQAFYDRELAVREQIAVESHLQDCPPCARELREFQMVGEALRLAAAPGPADDWTGVQPGVISRMRAEAHESWTARAARTFDDLHLVWIALASTAATFLCAATVLSMLHFASPERGDSLAAQIAVLAAPGSEQNPARLSPFIRFPAVQKDGVLYATLENAMMDEDQMLMVSAVVTREGRLQGLEVLGDDSIRDERDVRQLYEALSQERLEPAQYDGSPVAVNFAWLFANTTVRAKASS